MRNKNVKIGILLLAFLVIIGAGVVLYNQFIEKPTQGLKEIEVEVILADGSTNSYDIKTDQEYLRGALDEKKLIEGSESEYGFYVTTVDGVTANEDNQEWWSLSRNGESLTTGVNDTPINDGDEFQITLIVGY